MKWLREVAAFPDTERTLRTIQLTTSSIINDLDRLTLDLNLSFNASYENSNDSHNQIGFEDVKFNSMKTNVDGEAVPEHAVCVQVAGDTSKDECIISRSTTEDVDDASTCDSNH